VRRIFGASLVAAGVVAVAALFVAVATAAGPEVLVAGDAHGLAQVRAGEQGQAGGHANPHKGGGSNLIYHNGPIMTSAVVRAVYWGDWSSASAQDELNGLSVGSHSFYSGIGGSSYINTNTEYTGFNGRVTTSVSNGGSKTDTSSPGSRDPGTSAVLAEVLRQYPSPTADGYYPVYTDIPRGNAGYCAWHSWGQAPNGVMVKFAFFFRLDNDPGCDPGDSVTGHSQGLAALANVSGHELSEAVTDPEGSAWYDRQGAENADKCAWQFNGAPQTFTDGTRWYVQGNWSNAAAGCIWTK